MKSTGEDHSLFHFDHHQHRFFRILKGHCRIEHPVIDLAKRPEPWPAIQIELKNLSLRNIKNIDGSIDLANLQLRNPNILPRPPASRANCSKEFPFTTESQQFIRLLIQDNNLVVQEYRQISPNLLRANQRIINE